MRGGDSIKTSDEDAFSKVNDYFKEISITPTNIFALDFILKGGIEESTTYQLVGESGVGKSTISLTIAKNICSQNKHVVYVDSEGSVSKQLLESLDLIQYMKDNLFTYIRESTFNKVEEILDSLIATDEVSLIIVDSLATLVNDGFTNLKGGISITTNNTKYTSGPLVLFMNKYKTLAMTKKYSLILVNQYRNTIDMNRGTVLKEYGAKNVKYNSDVILRIGPIKSKSKYSDFNSMTKPFDSGVELCFEVIKSNKASPLESIPFYLCYGRGISDVCNYFYALMKLEIIKQNGGYYEIKNDNIYIKRQGVKSFYNELLRCEFDFEYYKNDIQEYYEKC